MKTKRWKAILRAKGYYRNKKSKFWGGDHLFYYEKGMTGREVFEEIKYLEEPECWGCGGDGLNSNNEACMVCKGKGWTDEY